MIRPRLVQGLSSLSEADQAAALDSSSTEHSSDLHLPATPSSLRLAAVGSAGAMRQVQMENIHPLRLRILLEIERTGSISAAAETCGIGQPSASMHLRTLETAIGQKLATRTGRGSSLTAEGKIVASHGARVLATLDSMCWALDTLGAETGGELTVAASLAPSVGLIPPILRHFSDRYPSVTVTLRTLPSEVVVREVARGGAAIGIAGEVTSAEPIMRTQIMMDELVGIAPVGLLSSEGGVVGRKEFARHSLLLGSEGSSTKLVTERCLGPAEYRPARTWAFDSYEAIKRAVADGLGVSFISQFLVREEIARGDLEPFRLSGVERMVRPIHAVQSSVNELTPQSAAFMALLIGASPFALDEEPSADEVAFSNGNTAPVDMAGGSSRHWVRRSYR
jgi:LysR family transcriptional regulator, low CO2-responsive transcriptional regulator